MITVTMPCPIAISILTFGPFASQAPRCHYENVLYRYYITSSSVHTSLNLILNFNNATELIVFE